MGGMQPSKKEAQNQNGPPLSCRSTVLVALPLLGGTDGSDGIVMQSPCDTMFRNGNLVPRKMFLMTFLFISLPLLNLSRPRAIHQHRRRRVRHLNEFRGERPRTSEHR